MFYTYAHYTPQGRLFYIGKGQGRRAYIFHKRNNYWNHVVEKHGKPDVEILARWDTEEEAFSHEILLIECFKELGHKLVNLSNGGEGPSGLQHSEEFKQKISNLHIDNKWRLGRPTSAKQKAIASALSKGNSYAVGNTNQRKWVWVGINIQTGEVIRVVGEKTLKEHGFQHANIIKCINGTRKSHKGYTWTKEKWEDKSWH
jgi:hypothetical protein